MPNERQPWSQVAFWCVRARAALRHAATLMAARFFLKIWCHGVHERCPDPAEVASLIDLEAEMFVAIAILTVAAVIAVYAISLWIDTPTS